MDRRHRARVGLGVGPEPRVPVLRARSERRTTALIASIALVVALVASGCGTRRSHSDVVAAAGGSGAVERVAQGSSGDGGDQAPAIDSGPGEVAGGASAGQAGSGSQTSSGSAARGSASGGSASDRGAGSASRTGAAGSTITIGSVGTLSGPVGGSLVGGVRALQAWVAAQNANGGLRGHPVKLVIADDGGDPARHRALVQQFVERDKVIAFVHNVAPLSGQAAVSYLQDKQIPHIGTEGGSPWVNENSMYFPQMPNDRVLGVSVAGAIAQVAKEAGRSKIALLYCAEVPGCKVVNTSGKEVLARAGIKTVYEGQASLAQPDYTAECLGARNAGADILFPTLDQQSIPRFGNSCASIGYRPLFAWVATTTAPSLAATPSLAGAVVGSPTVPWFAASSPPVAEFTATMKQYAPTVAIDGAAIQGWTSAKLFERAARDIGATVTAHDILKGLWSIKSEDLGGLTVPLTFAEGQQKNGNLTPCWWTVVVRGGKYTALNGAQRQCP